MKYSMMRRIMLPVIFLYMIILTWNYRGAASVAFGRSLKELVRIHNPNLVVLLETRCSGDNAKNVISKLGFPFYHIEEACGFSGGIWIIWRDSDLAIDFLVSKTQYVHMRIQEGNHASWIFTAIYASPQERVRKQTWRELRNIATNMGEEWLLAGEFNEIIHPLEKKGGGRSDAHACRKFRNWINNCSLMDLRFCGSKFTWRGPKWEGLERVFKRLDRALSNAS
ncbi:uncharacterized protein LOC107461695 [Arachis duranensis]|uniref:Uncharacterized protein LOC107461695 n=1 Tax=Arachis duranensis TaxID=130453 RepID=A0A6P4BVA1_ARADU|nr:uncharacterized protein LOC107461695 [Arachis duranensis]